MGRRIIVQQHDTLVVCGFEIDAEILAAVLDPANRTLWAFIHSTDGAKIEPCAVDEERCIWLEESDLFRGAKDDPQWTGQTVTPIKVRKKKVSVRR